MAAFTTALDLATLNHWQLLPRYTRNKTEFVAVGKIVYQALTAYGGPPSGPIDLEQSLALALQVSNVFKNACPNHVPPILYPVFALALARYILDNEWIAVSHP